MIRDYNKGEVGQPINLYYHIMPYLSGRSIYKLSRPEGNTVRYSEKVNLSYVVLGDDEFLSGFEVEFAKKINTLMIYESLLINDKSTITRTILSKRNELGYVKMLYEFNIRCLHEQKYFDDIMQLINIDRCIIL